MTEKNMLILYGTETGNSELLAMDAGKVAEGSGFEATVPGMEDIELEEITQCQNLLIICSTWGDGEQPDNAMDLFDAVEEANDGELSEVKFAVLALGDTAFDLFCEAGKEWDRILEQKGAVRINERIDCDVDYEDDAELWIDETIENFD